jgi:hypothetical protein
MKRTLQRSAPLALGPTILTSICAEWCSACGVPLFVFHFRTDRDQDGPAVGEETEAIKELTRAARTYLGLGRAKLGKQPTQPQLLFHGYAEEDRGCPHHVTWSAVFAVNYDHNHGAPKGTLRMAERRLIDAAHKFALDATPATTEGE